MNRLESFVSFCDKYQLVTEGYLFNTDDLYYNKDKFDSGEINLCFITGHSGSGKSTMGNSMSSHTIEHVQMDDLQIIKEYCPTLSDVKKRGEMLYSYFSGPGKRFYINRDELINRKIPITEYEDKLFKDFVYFSMKYAATHKNKQFVVEGVYLLSTDESGKPYFKPDEFKDYALYIKGTSMLVSKHRASLRDAKEDSTSKPNEIKNYLHFVIHKNWKWYFLDESNINRFKSYFSKLIYDKDDIKLQYHDSISLATESKLSNTDHNMEKIKEFNKELALYEYGVVHVDGSITYKISSGTFDNYKILSPSDFRKHKCGICWDYVAYEASRFHFCKHKEFFFCLVDKNGAPKHTHTFLLFYLNDKVYWFEASWKSHIGIFEFENEDIALSYIIHTLSSIQKEKDFYIVSYNPKNYISLTEDEFTRAMTKLPEYNYKIVDRAHMKTIQSIKLDRNGNILEGKN